MEVLLSRLDLASLCVGTPTPSQGFIDIDMKTIVRESGLGQRRCERAIGLLKKAGFLKVTQRRGMTSEGKYFGLRAIRVFTVEFFEWLGLGTMLKTERKRASEALVRKAKSVGKTLAELMGRVSNIFKIMPEKKKLPPEISRNWTKIYIELTRAGLESKEAQKMVNSKFGYPAWWSPGHGCPW